MKRPPVWEVARRTEPLSRRRALPENYEKAVGREGLSGHSPNSLARGTGARQPLRPLPLGADGSALGPDGFGRCCRVLAVLPGSGGAAGFGRC